MWSYIHIAIREVARVAGFPQRNTLVALFDTCVHDFCGTTVLIGISLDVRKLEILFHETLSYTNRKSIKALWAYTVPYTPTGNYEGWLKL